MKKLKTFTGIACVLAMLITAQAQSFITNGLVAYYPFNGNANDASGNGNNGTVNGATLTTNRFGNANSAYYFNGGTTSVSVLNSASLNLYQNLTVSVWVKTSSLNSGAADPAALVARGGLYVANTQWMLRLNSNSNFTFWVGDGNSDAEYVTSGVYTKGYWESYAVTFNSTNKLISLFINGILDATYTSAYTAQSNSAIAFILGNQVDTQHAFTGSLDDVRIYNRALSTNELAQLFQIESAPILNAFNAIGVATANLKVGTNYQFQVSSNLVNWINSGSVFTATNSSWTNYYPATSTSQFYRLLQH